MASVRRRRRNTAWGSSTEWCYCSRCKEKFPSIESHYENIHSISKLKAILPAFEGNEFSKHKEDNPFCGNTLKIGIDGITEGEDSTHWCWPVNLKNAVYRCIKNSIFDKTAKCQTPPSWIKECYLRFGVSKSSLKCYYYQEYYPKRLQKGSRGYKSDTDQIDLKLSSNPVKMDVFSLNKMPLGVPWRSKDPLSLFMDDYKRVNKSSKNDITYKGIAKWFGLSEEERSLYVEKAGKEDSNKPKRNQKMPESHLKGIPTPIEGLSPLSFSAKRATEPLSLGNQQNAAIFGGNLTPYSIIVNKDEDLLAKLSAVLEERSWNACILSATGSLCSCTVQHHGSPVSTKYEGSFEIIKLSGTFGTAEADGSQSRFCHTSLSIADIDGHMYGGIVAGPLMAAGHVQVVLGIFSSTCPADYTHCPRSPD